MRPIDADAFVREMNDRIKEAMKWGANAIADRNDEIIIRAEQAIATFCEASLTAKKLPTIDAEPVRHGRWINGKCSECGCDRVVTKVYRDDEVVWISTYRDNYCPNCGTKMDLEEVEV